MPRKRSLLALRQLSQNLQKRTLVCTFVALTSGLFWSFVGGQISVNARTQKCQSFVWPLKQACTTIVTPVAFWQGSTTGLWTGAILGAFIAGLATQSEDEETQPSSDIPTSELKLTPQQREEIGHLLILLMTRLDRANETDSLILATFHEQRKQLLLGKTLTETDVQKILLALQNQEILDKLAIEPQTVNPTQAPQEWGQ